jgi:hypothetical protein
LTLRDAFHFKEVPDGTTQELSEITFSQKGEGKDKNWQNREGMNCKLWMMGERK